MAWRRHQLWHCQQQGWNWRNLIVWHCWNEQRLSGCRRRKQVLFEWRDRDQSNWRIGNQQARLCRHTSDKWRWRERRKLTWLGKDWLWYCRACLRDHQIGNLRDPWYRMEVSRRECKGLDVPWRSCSYHQQIWAGRECGRLAQALEMVASIDSFGERQGNLLKGPRVPKFSKP